MKRKKKLIILITVLMSTLALVYLKLLKDTRGERAFSKVTVKVIDEAGEPIKNANVNIGFLLDQHWDKSISKTFHGKSNSNGEYSSTFLGARESGISATKHGYYRSTTRYKRDEIKNVFWQPWNPTIELVLRKKINPIPLYTKKTKINLTTNYVDFVGYDVFVGDLVEPYGKGTSNDLLFLLEKNRKTAFEYSWKLIVKFANEEDGFYKIYPPKLNLYSKLVFPNKAPEDNYNTKEIICSSSANPQTYTQFRTTDDSGYLFFKIRTHETNSYYGKALNFEYYITRDGLRVEFIYYLNPTINSRNMEFDTHTNLFKNIKSYMKIRQP